MLDIIDYHFDDVARANGKKVVDYDEQYEKLLALRPQIEEAYASGQIDEIKYKEFIGRIEELR